MIETVKDPAAFLNTVEFMGPVKFNSQALKLTARTVPTGTSTQNFANVETDVGMVILWAALTALPSGLVLRFDAEQKNIRLTMINNSGASIALAETNFKIALLSL
jgi:hypothetical protein